MGVQSGGCEMVSASCESGCGSASKGGEGGSLPLGIGDDDDDGSMPLGVGDDDGGSLPLGVGDDDAMFAQRRLKWVIRGRGVCLGMLQRVGFYAWR